MRGHSDIIFARRLRMFRLQASLTQQHLADQMTAAGHHMANSAISNIESGRRLVTHTGDEMCAAAQAWPPAVS
jgi:transcriptional regulator with XRE-family HTH domain